MTTPERKTENLLERALRAAGFKDEDFQFQGSEDPEVQRCLPSKKSGKAGAGKPEHIIRLNGDAADLLVTECKASHTDHASTDGLHEDSPLKPIKYAEDGVLHYMKGLLKEFNVIGLAVSGVDAEKLRISTFKALRGGRIERLTDITVLKRESYLSALRQSAGYGEKTEAEIQNFAKELHEYLRDQMELSEAYKPLIVSGILLALKNGSFEKSYRETAEKDDLADNLVQAIAHTLKAHKVKEEKRQAMMAGYEFIRVNKSVKEHLHPTIAKIYRHLFFALSPSSSLDLLGNFYGEFLRYSGGDQQGLGIVLTPRHITDLFAELADLNPRHSVVLDLCTGTSGFLISAMAHMLQKAGNDSDLIKRVKQEALVGIELDQHMFTLACANMIFRGDGKANMFWDDCLTPREPDTQRLLSALKPNVAMLNPPYSKKAKGKHELNFVLRALELLQENGIALAIIPVAALNTDTNEGMALRRELLEKHTLRAVMSMPAQLFPGVGTVTVIAVFLAHKPHMERSQRHAIDDHGKPLINKKGENVIEEIFEAKNETWFGYWRDDGFTMSKGKRIEKNQGSWEATKKTWVESYRKQKVVPGASCKQAVTHLDEWLAEAYLTTDYSLLTRELFERDVKRFALYNLMLNIQGSPADEEASDET